MFFKRHHNKTKQVLENLLLEIDIEKSMIHLCDNLTPLQIDGVEQGLSSAEKKITTALRSLT